MPKAAFPDTLNRRCAHVSIGERFGLIVATCRGPNGPQRQQQWWFHCDCGNEKLIRLASVLSGRTTSCGCVGLARLSEHCRGEANNNFKHGLTGTPEFSVWSSMIQRCSDPNCKAYRYYGARGIKVCERWRESFACFLADMGKRPAPGREIDRIDNDGNYEPGNCRWATKSEQALNRRPKSR